MTSKAVRRCYCQLRTPAAAQLLAIIGYRKWRGIRLAAIVLAGGLSSRMGTDKATLLLEGERLVDRAVRITGEVARPVIVVADVNGKFDVHAAQVIGDETPLAGPLGGIVTGLRHVDEGPHLVLACDLPLVRAGLLRLI